MDDIEELAVRFHYEDELWRSDHPLSRLEDAAAMAFRGGFDEGATSRERGRPPIEREREKTEGAKNDR